MNESLRDAIVADLVDDLRRLSTLERAFLHNWRSALGMMSSTPQLAQVLDGVERLAGLEAQTQRDEDAAVLAAIERAEFELESQQVGDRWSKDVHVGDPGPADDSLPQTDGGDEPDYQCGF